MSEANLIAKSVNGPVTVHSLIADFERLGVQPGMTLLVHSSLSALGWVNGGSVAVIQALQMALTPAGTLVMPTHSGGQSDPAPWQHPPVPKSWIQVIRDTMPVYDPAVTPTRGMGAIPELFRTLPGVRRSDHPQLSFAAWGAQAAFVTANHTLADALGEESPLARVYELGGSILLLGVRHDSNTSLHLAEHRADYPGKAYHSQGTPLLVDGERQWVTFEEQDYDESDFPALGQAYEASGKSFVEGRVGYGEAKLIPQRALVDFAVGWLPGHRGNNQ